MLTIQTEKRIKLESTQRTLESSTWQHLLHSTKKVNMYTIRLICLRFLKAPQN
jgi:hypothetical protein